MMFDSIRAVAYVEDDDILRKANVQSLGLAGFEVSAFATAREAWRRSISIFPESW